MSLETELRRIRRDLGLAEKSSARADEQLKQIQHYAETRAAVERAQQMMRDDPLGCRLAVWGICEDDHRALLHQAAEEVGLPVMVFLEGYLPWGSGPCEDMGEVILRDLRAGTAVEHIRQRMRDEPDRFERLLKREGAGHAG